MKLKRIEIKDIHFRYPRGRQIFDGFSYTFEQGKIYGIIGENGAGKTTLSKILLNLLKVDAGTITMDGQDMQSMTLGEIGQSLGYVYQNPARQLFAASVQEELAFPLQLKGQSREEVDRIVEEQLKRFDLLECKDKFPFYLSQGEKQRLVIAGILLRTPEFLILDEPTTSLDIVRKEELRKRLVELNEKEKMGLIIISHDYEFLEKLNCEWVTITSVEGA